MLTRTDLSIHLVGDTYGGVPVGPSQKSEVVLQNEQATLRSQSHGMPRIIWRGLPRKCCMDTCS